MFRQIKAARLRTKLKKHNIQDARVTVDCTRLDCNKSGSEKSRSIKNLLEAFLLRQALFELWSNRYVYWEDICEFAGMLWGWLAP